MADPKRFYKTPENAIKKLFKHLDYSRYIHILDPCAGGDSNNHAVFPFVLKELGFDHVVAMDVRTEAKADIFEDFLKYEFRRTFDLIIANPPFSLALDFFYKSWLDIKDNGDIIFLLRLGFLASKRRYSFFKEYPLKDVFVLSERPSFTDDGKTDHSEYAFFRWRKEIKKEETKLYII